MKKKTQIERFLDYEVAIKINNADEFEQYVKLMTDAGYKKMTHGVYHSEYNCYRRLNGSQSYRDTKESTIRDSNLPVEDFILKEKQEVKPRVLVNGNATIVWFEDGDKVVVKHTDDLPYDSEKAIAMACAKKLLGGYGKFKELLDLVEVKSDKKYAIVEHGGKRYSIYTDFFVEYKLDDYLKNYPRVGDNLDWDRPSEVLPYNGEKVEVLVEYPHLSFKDEILVVVRKSNGVIGLIAKRGLKFL